MGDTDILVEQQAYYDARAPEYDDWWLRRGRYDQGDVQRSLWRAQTEQLRAWLRGLGPLGRVLELAAGTGNWTGELAVQAEDVVAVDGSADALAINRGKLDPDASVRLVRSDLFGFAPPGRFDTVFFSFWLSHVPVNRRHDHWALVRSALDPAGRIVMIDNAHPQRASGAGFGRVHGSSERMAAGGRERRRLADGRGFEVVKHYWRPDELVADSREHGVQLVVGETDHYFLHAHGRVVEEGAS